MFDYKAGLPPQEKDLFDLAVDWMDQNPVRWNITACWGGVGITIAILAVLSKLQVLSVQ